MATNCTVTIERLASGAFRASASHWPDCTATAPTEEEARRAVEKAIEDLTKRTNREAPPAHHESH